MTTHPHTNAPTNHKHTHVHNYKYTLNKKFPQSSFTVYRLCMWHLANTRSLVLFVCQIANSIGYTVLSYLSPKISQGCKNAICGTECCTTLILHAFWSMSWSAQNSKTVANKPLLKRTFFLKNSGFHGTVYCSIN